MIVNGTMLRAGVEEVVAVSRLVRSDKTNVAMNTVIYGLFCDFTQRRMVVPYRRFGTTYRSHLQVSSSSKISSFQTESNPVHRRFVCLFVRSFVLFVTHSTQTAVVMVRHVLMLRMEDRPSDMEGCLRIYWISCREQPTRGDSPNLGFGTGANNFSP
jgi:hypothetical protein